jgi:biopolymer transport protein ExbB
MTSIGHRADMRPAQNRASSAVVAAMLRLLLLLAILLAPAAAQAWWNKDWTARKQITLDTSEAGLPLKQALTQVLVPVRLHTGNFSFAEAREDGADLRFVAQDDKTPLKFHIEQFDGVSELAVVWVQVPALAPGAKDQHLWMYYGNDKAAPAEDAKGSFDAATLAALHFNEKAAPPKDLSANAHAVAQASARFGVAGLLGGGATFDGTAAVTLAPAPTLKLAATGGLTIAAWIKPADTAGGTVFHWQDGTRAITLALAQGKLIARAPGADTPAAGELRAGAWQHVAVTLSDRLVVYLNGVEIAQGAARTPEMAGTLTIGAPGAGDPKGAGFKGDIDEVVVASVARGADWMRLAASHGSADSKFMRFGAAAGGEEGSSSYMGILLDAVTLDGWIVIGILGVMLVVSFWVMFAKTVAVVKIDRSNGDFLDAFRGLARDITPLAKDGAVDARTAADSPLYRLYRIGVAELAKRVGAGESGAHATLSPAAISAIRATIDAGFVREMARLNSRMVLLTISISGGPFLGLLGTVVGVMITFAAIAAAGDVNVNAIAPGIAAALVATVAGLAVAIPALFGYNYIGSRIKNISADMQVFVDEFETRVAESYAA